ncbi:MAG TPA: adenylate/guanylate cyclase domain-containing protein [Gaiellales bacterium]|nr:adenylate/guanylate cyclase domain-containing protein [Gaiellales bacterium]
MHCSACGTDNEPGRKFCGECGAPLRLTCAACGSANAPAAKFCGECGTSLAAPPAAIPAPAAERRLVTVLFADLVGFTSHAEARDPEDVRELLSRYFELCRTLIDRYGGTVEKFIGDAVMAVWGAPVAKEDDIERAVRAALDLAASVDALGQELGVPELRARAGILTGEAAVTVGAVGQGMVAGDLVNTASRIQAVAEPGGVLAGETTKRATEAAVMYEDAGVHELKGKAEPVQLWRAVRVIGGRGGALRSTGLESPFVGRDRELRVIKELFHASAGESKAHLVSVMAVAGTGKSRLSWEFFKYIDGLADDVRWHRGRCLPYGEGVTYWALAEMVRTRAAIAEGEDPDAQVEKLHAAVEESIADPEERRFVEPRLAHLLGLEAAAPADRENLFSAWRLFYERLADEMPTVMVFEDMEWADASLLDFIEYLVDWSKNHPLFVIVLARPDLAERRPTWGAGKRTFTSLYLEPLSSADVDQLLAGLVPGLPDDLRAAIRGRAEGVPLYAVETVRMLLDRGLLVARGSAYEPAGAIGPLDVPETLHALIAARLDGLSAGERRIVQDAAVLGKTFALDALSKLTGLGPVELEPPLAQLVRKEVLTLQVDPLSPERGQYGFLQDLMRRVAYDMLSKHERKARHLAAAALDEDDDEVVEVVAAHYLAARDADPDAEDADDIARRAAAALVRAGERAGSLAASMEAQRYFEQAADLTAEPFERARLFERAGMMARDGARSADALAHFERAVELFDEAGASHPRARVSARLGEVMWDTGRLKEALERMDAALDLLSTEEPDADVAELAHQVGRFRFFAGDPDVAAERVEQALILAERLNLPDVLSQAVNTKAMLLSNRGRMVEAGALMRLALQIALDHDLPSTAIRAYNNAADFDARADRYEQAAEGFRNGLALARRVGLRQSEWQFLGQVYPLYALGRWDEALELASGVPEEAFAETRFPFMCLLGPVVSIHSQRGDVEAARRLVALHPEIGSSDDLTERTAYMWAHAAERLASGDARVALDDAARGWETRDEVGIPSEVGKETYVLAVDAALSLGDFDRADRIVATVEALGAGGRPQSLTAHAMRHRALLAASAGDGERADQLFRQAAALFHELAMPFPMAVTLLQHGGLLTGTGAHAEAAPLLETAGEVFGSLEARPWLERLERARDGQALSA